MILTAGTRLGPYEVDGLIGAGGMGEVYKAHLTRLDRAVAVKILPDNIPPHPIAGRVSSAKPARSRHCRTRIFARSSTWGSTARRFFS